MKDMIRNSKNKSININTKKNDSTKIKLVNKLINLSIN